MRIVTLVIAVLSLFTTSHSATASDPVVVHLASGRTFTAHVDQQTDDSTLWLRFQTASTLLLRPVEWQRVVSAEVAGKTLTGEQLREAADQLKSPAEKMPWPEEVVTPPANTSMADLARHALSAAPIVQDLAIDAQLGNWDLDAQTDGMRVRLLPMDQRGTLIPVGATVDIQLLAPLRRRFHDAPRSRGQSLEVIANWTRFLQPGDFTAEGLELLLPFQAIHPEEDDRVAPFGIITVRMAIPGHGVIERRLEVVRVRPYSPIAD